MGLVLLIGAVLQAGVIAAAASFLANLDKHRLALRQRLDEKAAVFRRLSSPCTLALVDLLAPVVVLPREYVLVQGSVGNEMFFECSLSQGVSCSGPVAPVLYAGAGSTAAEAARLTPQLGHLNSILVRNSTQCTHTGGVSQHMMGSEFFSSNKTL